MLYHRTLIWDSRFDMQSLELLRTVNSLSNHMWRNINNGNKRHRIDLVKLYTIVNSLKAQNYIRPFEVETIDRVVVKAVIRVEYDNEYDISIVYRENMIITAWLNKKDDIHETLDNKKYKTY